MWESPIYRFRIPKDPEDEDNSELLEIVINVNDLAPRQQKPSEKLKEVVSEIFKKYKKIDTVLDFGAGKLRITPYFLGKEKNVCAVEFKELAENRITKSNLKKCEKFGDKFWKLVFPNPFIQDSKKFDLIALINVVHTMPVLAERLLLHNILYNKLKKDGYIFWYEMRETSKYKS